MCPEDTIEPGTSRPNPIPACYRRSHRSLPRQPRAHRSSYNSYEATAERRLARELGPVRLLADSRKDPGQSEPERSRPLLLDTAPEGPMSREERRLVADEPQLLVVTQPASHAPARCNAGRAAL